MTLSKYVGYSRQERKATDSKDVESENMFVKVHELLSACCNKRWLVKGYRLKKGPALLLAVTHTNQSCVQAVDMVNSAAGTTGIYTKNKLAHYFTDAQVIRQHDFSSDSR